MILPLKNTYHKIYIFTPTLLKSDVITKSCCLLLPRSILNSSLHTVCCWPNQTIAL